MIISFGKAMMVGGLLAFGGTLSGPPSHQASSPGAVQSDSTPVVTIRVSQESAPGAGDFDKHILGTIKSLPSTGKAGDFYMMGRSGPRYGNSKPALIASTAHFFFVNGSDGLAFFAVYNKGGGSSNGTAKAKFELSGGTAKILVSDDQGEAAGKDSVFTNNMNWQKENSDGMALGPLPTGFTITGQFTAAPTGLKGGWFALSSDTTKIPLTLVPGQRVRLDVK
jgi:hypothetical protein